MFKYSLKVWLTSIFLGPTIWFIIDSTSFITESGFTDFFQFLLIFAIFGAIFSIPAFLLFMLSNVLIAKVNIEDSLRRTFITVIAFVINYSLFFLLFGFDRGNDIEEMINFSSSYSISLILGIWYFKMSHKHENHRQTRMD